MKGNRLWLPFALFIGWLFWLFHQHLFAVLDEYAIAWLLNSAAIQVVY